jgi:Protein of unknown function (DUF3592)
VSLDRLVRHAWLLFPIVGGVFFVVGVVILVDTARFVSEADRATGTVIDLSRSVDEEGSVTFSPVVRFTTAQGRTIEFVSSSSSSSPPQQGDDVEVLYDPDDPGDARLAGFFDLWFLPVAFTVLGAAACAIGPLVRRLVRGRTEPDADRLRAQGLRVRGDSLRVVVAEEVTVQGRSPFRVEVDVHDWVQNQVRVLTSEDVWFDPRPHLEGRDALDVYVDPKRPERYYVDLSFLPRHVD